MSSRTTLLSQQQASLLLEQVIYERVREHVDHCALYAIEENLAIDLARLSDITDPQMLATARGMVASALRRLADEREGTREAAFRDEEALRTRYLNARCREVDSATAMKCTE